MQIWDGRRINLYFLNLILCILSKLRVDMWEPTAILDLGGIYCLGVLLYAVRMDL